MTFFIALLHFEKFLILDTKPFLSKHRTFATVKKHLQ